MGRGKSVGYRGWVRNSICDYDFMISRVKKIGHAKIISHPNTSYVGNRMNTWVAEVSSDIKGVFKQTTVSMEFKTFREALMWLNKQRKHLTKAIYG